MYNGAHTIYNGALNVYNETLNVYNEALNVYNEALSVFNEALTVREWIEGGWGTLLPPPRYPPEGDQCLLCVV